MHLKERKSTRIVDAKTIKRCCGCWGRRRGRRLSKKCKAPVFKVSRSRCWHLWLAQAAQQPRESLNCWKCTCFYGLAIYSKGPCQPEQGGITLCTWETSPWNYEKWWKPINMKKNSYPLNLRYGNKSRPWPDMIKWNRVIPLVLWGSRRKHGQWNLGCRCRGLNLL